ncbi:hypothetical protein PCANC_28542 [Puccinia coronata f. sp. avenae]|uniref:Uncharacterized protein n=1 Tax=Puccinia coronata f. sp. avenae TaxID=200324 RepID=A0A2N5RUG7_9BASI|nr:hypothetical protein PCANC_28542 [Puccinia coronata f. sp. avenae]
MDSVSVIDHDPKVKFRFQVTESCLLNPCGQINIGPYRNGVDYNHHALAADASQSLFPSAPPLPSAEAAVGTNSAQAAIDLEKITELLVLISKSSKYHPIRGLQPLAEAIGLEQIIVVPADPV